jgi:predicted RecA/RadA family phage recombinase
MLVSSSLGLTGLKHIAPDRAQVTKMVLALLDGKKGDTGLSLSSRRIDLAGLPNDSEWMNCGRGVFLNIAIAAGCHYVFREGRLAEMVAALDEAEPLLSEIEARTGLLLDPTDAVSVLPPDCLTFEVSAAEPQHLITLVLSPDFDPPSALHQMFDALEIDWSKVPVVFHIQIIGPSLSVEAAAMLESGDLVLIGGMATGARLIWPLETSAQTAQIISGRYDLLSGGFTANSIGDTMATNATNGVTGFSVPLSIRLPNRMTTAAELSAMQPGTTINIGAVTQGLEVSILVADQEIARGELVQVGDQFGVLIEQKTVHRASQSHPNEVAEAAE